MSNESRPHDPNELDIARLIDGDLGDLETERLANLIEKDSDLRKTYMRHVVMQAMLRWSHGSVVEQNMPGVNPAVILELLAEAEEVARRRAASEEAERAGEIADEAARRKQITEAERRFVNRRPEPIVIPVFAMYATAATVIVAASIFIYQWLPRHGPHQPIPDSVLVATISDSVDARWSDPAAPPIAVGARLAVGKRVLSTGVIQITFDSGANVVLESPAEIDLISDSEARLMQGRLVGVVPHEAIGFAIRAPGATIVDLGTEFGIEVEKEGSSEVHVMTGMVEVAANNADLDKAGTATPKRLNGGSALQIDEHGKTTAIEFDSTGFFRKVPRVVWVSKRVSADRDARLVDLDGDERGDRVDLLHLPPVASERNPKATDNTKQSRVSVGERDSVEGADEDERRYWIAFDLTESEREDILTSDIVHLAVKLVEKNNVSGIGSSFGVDVFGVLRPTSPTPEPQGFQALAEPLILGAFDEHTSEGERRLLDVTEFAKAQVRKGQQMLAFRMEIFGHRVPHRDGKHNSFVFSNRQTGDVSDAPALQMKVRRYERVP